MRQIYNFNTKWGFSKEALEAPTTMPERWNWVNIPHTWNNIDGQDGGNDLYRGTAFYAKELEKMDLPKADRYFLEIQGANSSAILYINGKKLANHDGGYSTWRVDITDALEDKNLFVFEVDNSQNDRVYPQNADFTFYGGIYRDLNIIAVNESHFDLEYYGTPGIKVTPEVVGKDAKVEVEVFVKNAKETQKLVYTLKDAEGNVVAEKETPASETVASFEIENVHLWHGKKDPYLYTAEVCLKDEEVLDNVSARFGCRTFEIHPENGFILNGEEYPLRGVSRHQDRWGIGNALLKEHHDEDMDLICELGATTIRLAHYQHDQYFYDLCDERGMVVWAEIPYISTHMPNGRENTISQMKELVVQNYNHPSIIVWGLSNEITMHGDSDEDLRENHVILNDLVHEMDKTRLTTMACVSMCSMDDPYVQIPDTVSYNHYFGWYGGDTSQNGPWFDEFHAKYPNIPIGCSEYGCEALNWHISDPQQGDYTEEYQAYYHEELIKQFYTRKYMWATHVWNMFDFGADSRNEGGENGQNHKGLITFDRKYKKDSFYAYKAWLSDEPFVHICGKRYVDRVEETTKVTVYSNQPEVELFANGVSLGKQTCPEHFFYFEVPNTGETTLVAVAGDCKDESFIRKVEVFNEEYRLKEKGAILNWFDVTAPEGYYSLNSKIEDIVKSEEGATVFKEVMVSAMGSMMGGNSEKFDIAPMMKMLGSFTVLRLTSLLGATNVTLTKEQLLDMNEKLNAIPVVE
ncbi:glycoside hydrolase family 2 protein [Intestinibacter bartlettii]|uniref:glycoside hydrolase family 2 protein n=1 Tax=Intestinibacter bartlettii TaxID=261299 RepID=UPI001D02EBC2|nr:glycoside hydrolase family 2 TIM barrel-domain containing protein [Intestinibacter bartlettii]MCB5746950.1 glycoside hydrolase family 2 protein [Intestinibacter bartlettii]MDU1254788.1 glycoside hydrolase family 2 TIM barrel-domain containing protein [Peptostreptococcaceae bacterium]MDU2692757.1 glycoside hydrolase family 2 TIM barrel-domain containing protein [Intestinibacter bartlettii]MDU6199401.1 glycoside hydrolase family 2 TIM barrel-domain containing protein [Intestinibacter bartletti